MLRRGRSSSGDDDSSDNDSSSESDNIDDAGAAAPTALCAAGDICIGKASLFVETGKVLIGVGQTARLRRWSRSLEGHLPWGVVGVRKQILMCATEASSRICFGGFVLKIALSTILP
jgi:hypothetical protein